MALERIVTLLVLSFALSACGWQLRGDSATLNTDGERVGVVSQVNNPIAADLREQLTLSKALAVDGNETLTISIGRIRQEKRVVAVDQIGEASVYRITLSTEVTITDANGETVSPATRMSQSGNYNFDKRILDAMTEEEQSLIQRLEQQLAQAIARKATILGKSLSQ
ncbi:LPS assembly lipoprotein LptE [uncultured Umboniibacter sp.]|uniref:LPS-assembly lipoprotein LptE n=1 Tax=uncultured Umboniibacter sp. TaxID=1798917 RepID=UPI0026257ADB|nr:LPS assembly lipoprotein LptE [uncultured Umboniibacter sp.]